MIEIHERFRKEPFRFCPLTKHTKVSFTDHNIYNYKWNDDVIQSHLRTGCNYGVMIGYGFDLIVDIDNKETYELIKHLLPETLEIISGIKKLPHLYYKIDFKPEGQREYQGFIDFLFKGKYGVGCNSVVLNDKNKEDKTLHEYKLGKDNEIPYLPEKNYKEIIRIIQPMYAMNKAKKSQKPKQVNEEINWYSSKVDNPRYLNNPTEIRNIKKLYKNKQGEWIFEAYFTDVDKIYSFALNKRMEALMFDILISGKDKALWYSVLQKNGKYMRQIKNV